MTLPASGNISIQDIAAEFNATLPKSLTDFYRGGAFVPDIAQNAGVPTAGSIRNTDFYGAVNITVSITDQTVTRLALTPADASVTYEVNTDGTIKRITGSSVTLETWMLSGVSSDYEVMFTHTSGTAPTGSALSTWLALSSSRSITMTRTSDTPGTTSGVVTVQIRKISDTPNADSASVTMNAEVSA